MFLLARLIFPKGQQSFTHPTSPSPFATIFILEPCFARELLYFFKTALAFVRPLFTTFD